MGAALMPSAIEPPGVTVRLPGIGEVNTGASATVSWSAPAGSVLITVVLLLTVGVALALLRSLSVNVVVVLEPGAPAFGVKTSACSSLVMVAAAAAANV